MRELKREFGWATAAPPPAKREEKAGAAVFKSNAHLRGSCFREPRVFRFFLVFFSLREYRTGNVLARTSNRTNAISVALFRRKVPELKYFSTLVYFDSII